MSTKIKALNEEEQSLDDDPDVTGRPSKEAQEELSISKYNQALEILRYGRTGEAVLLLEEIVSREDLKQLSVPQQKLQLGCLKVLGDLYREGSCKNLERCKEMYERAIFYDQASCNLTFWFRLGKVCYEMGDLYSAHLAFGQVLSIRSSHWLALEYMITVSYAIQDFTSCLHHCSVGLKLDPGFLKGAVFREMVYAVFPELRKENEETPSVPNLVPKHVEIAEKEKYLKELRQLQARSREKQASIQLQISLPTPKMHFDLRSYSVVDVLQVLLLTYEKCVAEGAPEFHKPVEVTWTIHQDPTAAENEEKGKSATADESQTEDESQSGIRRSRSSSDETPSTTTAPVDATSQSEGDAAAGGSGGAGPADGGEGAPASADPSQAQPADGEGCGKKKKGPKWWQMEGKRRSQRVRGHLIPSSPDKTKKESSFADQLKNLIPASLLGDDGSTSERELAKCQEKAGWQKKMPPNNYFGGKEEETAVKQLLGQMSGNSLSTIIANFVHFLTLKVKVPWPSQLRELYLYLYEYFRCFVPHSNNITHDSAHVIDDAYASLVYVEILLEKYRNEFSSGVKSFSKMASKEVFELEDVLLSSEPPCPPELSLRVKWLTIRRLLQLSAGSSNSDTELNREVCLILGEMETQLRKEPLTAWTVNETNNLICVESVSEKAVALAKTRNSQVVTDLYQSEQYESLISVLQSCINFAEVEKRDLRDIYFFTVALFKRNKSECIHHCLNLINQAIRFQESSSLAESLNLLEQIWEGMGARFTLTDKRSTVGTLLKILVAGERKAPVHESVLTVPWCLLHSLMYSLEREEPAIYLEEETVPNSILLLQMAHEWVSRTEKCGVDAGKLMLYTMKAVLNVKKLDEYSIYEETRHCMEQAIFCLYAHPNKKNKVKGLKDHNCLGTPLTWAMCPVLYKYYYPDELFEFDSIGSISAEVEALFQRILEIMPPELKPEDRRKKIKDAIAASQPLDEQLKGDAQGGSTALGELRDIYYLIADHCFKNKEWSKSVRYYTCDLALNPERLDSWAAIALCLAENVNTTLNTADNIDFDALLTEAHSTSYCFRNALALDPGNIKLRIEFGSFVYAMHAYCSRLMKQQQATDIDMERFTKIDNAKDEFLKSSCKCFELIARHPERRSSGAAAQMMLEEEETAEDEMWIHHYMLGKIKEKNKEEPDEFLHQYELAGKLLQDQDAPYPSKMNYYSPPELAIEALEIYYRVHASILTLIETSEYSRQLEKLFVRFIRRQEEGPFIKNKQSKDGESKKGRNKAPQDDKKDLTEITALVNELCEKAEKLAEETTPATEESAVTSSGVTSSTSSSDTETSTDSQSGKSEQPQQGPTSFSLTEFRKRLQEKEQREEEAAHKKAEQATPPAPPPPQQKEKEPQEEEKEVDLYEGLPLEGNPFYEDFKEVKYGAVISLCLRAMEECISRYPSHFKSYYRLAHSYVVFNNDAQKAREYLMGGGALSARKLTGLFGERKPTNLFNGIWRNPIDDIERPGSFSYHMNKSMQLLLDVLSRLNDHGQLADIGIYLTKKPDEEKKYLTNPDREMFCQQAWNMSVAAVRRKATEVCPNLEELGIEFFDTHVKLQKHNPRQNISNSIHDVYRLLFSSQGHSDEFLTVEHALRYFNTKHTALKQTTTNSRGNVKGAAGAAADAGRSGDGPPPRKRGRRGRQASQDVAPTCPSAAPAVTITSAVATATKPRADLPMLMKEQMELYQANITAALQHASPQMRNDINNDPKAILNFLESLGMRNFTLPPPPPAPSYPTINIDPGQLLRSNPLPPAKAPSSAVFPKSSKIVGPPPAMPGTSKGVSPSATAASAVMGVQKEAGKNKITLPPNITGLTLTRKPAKARKQQQNKQQQQQQQDSRRETPSPSAYPPATLANTPPTPRINTSPYKAQSAMVVPPPEFSFNKKGSGSRASSSKSPPVAHSQATPPKKTAEGSTVEDADVTVIDLTVKTPEKEKVEKTPPAARPVVRNPIVGPPSRHHYVDLRAIALNPVPGLTITRQQVPRTTVTTPTSSTTIRTAPAPSNSTVRTVPAAASFTTVRTTPATSSTVRATPTAAASSTVRTPPDLSFRPAGRMTMMGSDLTIRSTAAPTSGVYDSVRFIGTTTPALLLNPELPIVVRARAPRPTTSSSNPRPVATPRPSTSTASSNPRPIQPQIRTVAPRPAAPGGCPLPPKKKYHQMMQQEQQQPVIQPPPTLAQQQVQRTQSDDEDEKRVLPLPAVDVSGLREGPGILTFILLDAQIMLPPPPPPPPPPAPCPDREL